MSSEYEIIREQNLKKNVEFLEAIGLGADQKPVFRESKTKSKARPKSIDVTASAFAPENFELRRSSRVKKVEAEAFDPNVIDSIESWETKQRDSNIKRARGSIKREADGGESDEESSKKARTKASSAPKAPVVIDPASSRASVCSFEQFSSPELLGKPLSEHGKAHVMSLAFNGRVPKFSKYSGVVEWSNCVFLWVNIFDEKYSNVFSQGGELMNWFGGSLMTDESPITHRLVANNPNDPILLFVRQSTTEPYVPFGQLQLHSHELARHPIEITWKLLNFHGLRHSEVFRSVNNSV